MNRATDQAMKKIGATVPISSIKSCVVYDPTSGQIHHHHSVLTLVGGRELAEAEIAENALQALSQRRNPPRGELCVLHVAQDALEPGRLYRVDHAKRALILDNARG